MNKKGQDAKFLIGVLLLLIVFAFTVYYLVSNNNNLWKPIVGSAGSMTDDTDNDGIINKDDPCPCGSPPNYLNMQKEFYGHDKYCYGKETPETCQMFIDEKFQYILEDISGGTGAVELACFYNKSKDYTCPVLKEKKS